MPRHIVLLRGINLARRNRIAMPELRATLEAAGFREVKTYVQSGNVVLASPRLPEHVAADVSRLVQGRFKIDVVVLVRSREEMAEVVRRNPLAGVASDPKRYLVTFMSAELGPDVVQRMRTLAGPQEKFEVIGREVYSWHPEGVGRSPLWERLSGKAIGVSATSRNWTTVSTLLAMAGDAIPR